MDAFEPIAPPPEENEGQRAEGCLHIAADVDFGRWRYCQRPVHRGVWCAAHFAACHRWPGHVPRQRMGEDIVRLLSGGVADDAA